MRLNLTSAHLAWLRAGFLAWRVPELARRFNARFGRDLTEAQIKNALSHHGITSGRPPGVAPGERPRVWTEPMLAWLRAHRADGPMPEIGARFRALFGDQWSDIRIHGACERYGIRTGRDGRFTPANQPWNKGAEGYQAGGRSSDTRFLPGGVPWTSKAVWSYRRDSQGLWWLKVRDDAPGGLARRNWRQVQHLTYEAHRGPIPQGHVVVFLDGDRGNCLDPANLEAIDRTTLVRLNQQGWGEVRDPDLRRAMLHRARLFTRAHRVGEQAGFDLRARKRMIGTLAEGAR